MRLAWAVEVDLAGVRYRFATRELEVDGHTYGPGLEVAEQSRRVDLTRPIRLAVVSRERWGDAFRAGQYLVDGGRCALYLVVDERGQHRRHLWAEGTVEATRWDRPGRPLRFELQFGPSFGVLHPDMRVIDATIPSPDPPVDTSWELFTENLDVWYQLIIGYPGAGTNGLTTPCVPAPTFQISKDTFDHAGGGTVQLADRQLLLIAGYDIARRTAGGSTSLFVEVLEVGLKEIIPLDDGLEYERDLPQFTIAVKFARDKIGQDIGYTEYILQNGGSNNLRGTPETYIGFGNSEVVPPPATGGEAGETGGGEQFEGRPLRGLADIFAWVIQFRTNIRLDIGRHRAHADVINARYKIDTWVAGQGDALEWFRELLPEAPVTVVLGEEGAYLAHLPIEAAHEAVQVHLVEGQNCTRDGEMQVEPPTATAVTVRWGLARGRFVHSRTLGSKEGISLALPGGKTYTTVDSHPHWAGIVGTEVHGLRVEELDLGHVWDGNTADRVAIDHLLTRALPQRSLMLVLGPEWYHLHPGELARYTDADLGLVEHLCRVDDVVVGERVLARLVPLKSPLDFL